jgi:formate dehydrogenase assembly factor FdhD
MPEWPVYPSGIHDTGERPDFVPTVSGFDVEITLNKYNSTCAELSFSSPVNPSEFGLGFEGISDWIISWAEDAKSVAIKYNEVNNDLKLYIFRLTDLNGSMLPAPKVFPLYIIKQ